MEGPRGGERGARTDRLALLRYVLAWSAAGAVLVLVALALTAVYGEDDVTLPPVQEIELTTAVRNAGCALAPPGQSEPGLPSEGPAAPAARPDEYDEPPPDEALVGAVRRGIVVVHYRPGLSDGQVERLRELRRVLPRGTVLTPNPRMRFVVAVTAWRRLLGCPRMSPRTVDAVRLFRGRFVGSGPDAVP